MFCLRVVLTEDTPHAAVSPPSVYWLLTTCVSGFVVVRSGRTSLRKSSFWDSCDTRTPSSIKAATWKTTLPGLVGAFHLSPCVLLQNIVLSVEPFAFVIFLVVLSSFAFHCQFLSNHVSCSHPSVFILQRRKLFLLICWARKRDRFSWSCILFQLVMEYCLGSASDLLEGKCAYSCASMCSQYTVVWSFRQIICEFLNNLFQSTPPLWSLLCLTLCNSVCSTTSFFLRTFETFYSI